MKGSSKSTSSSPVGQKGYNRTLINMHVSVAKRGQHPNFRRPDNVSHGKHYLSRFHVLPMPPNVRVRAGISQTENIIRLSPGVFDHDHSVCSRRNQSPGHDADRFSRSTVPRKGLPAGESPIIRSLAGWAEFAPATSWWWQQYPSIAELSPKGPSFASRPHPGRERVPAPRLYIPFPFRGRELLQVPCVALHRFRSRETSMSDLGQTRAHESVLQKCFHCKKRPDL